MASSVLGRIWLASAAALSPDSPRRFRLLGRGYQADSFASSALGARKLRLAIGRPADIIMHRRHVRVTHRATAATERRRVAGGPGTQHYDLVGRGSRRGRFSLPGEGSRVGAFKNGGDTSSSHPPEFYGVDSEGRFASLFLPSSVQAVSESRPGHSLVPQADRTIASTISRHGP